MASLGGNWLNMFITIEGISGWQYRLKLLPTLNTTTVFCILKFEDISGHRGTLLE